MPKYEGFITYQEGIGYRIRDAVVWDDNRISFDTGEASYVYTVSLWAAGDSVKGSWRRRDNHTQGTIVGGIVREGDDITINGCWSEEGKDWSFTADLNPV